MNAARVYRDAIYKLIGVYEHNMATLSSIPYDKIISNLGVRDVSIVLPTMAVSRQQLGILQLDDTTINVYSHRDCIPGAELVIIHVQLFQLSDFVPLESTIRDARHVLFISNCMANEYACKVVPRRGIPWYEDRHVLPHYNPEEDYGGILPLLYQVPPPEMPKLAQDLYALYESLKRDPILNPGRVIHQDKCSTLDEPGVLYDRSMSLNIKTLRHFMTPTVCSFHSSECLGIVIDRLDALIYLAMQVTDHDHAHVVMVKPRCRS